MSAETPSWNTGAAHASDRRRAIVLRTDESWTTSTSPGRRGRGARRRGRSGARRPPAARSTSSARMRPSGPVPVSAARSTPRSRAIRRASGDALTDALLAGACAAASRLAAAALGLPRGSLPRSPRRGSPSGLRASVSAGTPPRSLSRWLRLRGVGRRRRLSPFVSITAIVAPTSTSPSATTILSRTPSTSASTSCVTLSVSSS